MVCYKVVTKVVILNLMLSIRYLGYEYLRSGYASYPFNYEALRSSSDLERSPAVLILDNLESHLALMLIRKGREEQI